MKKIRTVKRLISGAMKTEGAGVRLKRLFGEKEGHYFDPFLLLEDFNSSQPREYRKGFPWHPHRGIEIITYVKKGRMEYVDSRGNGGAISEGDVQWITTGSGIIHQELPVGNTDKQLHAIQLWANIPSGRKMCEPRFQNVPHARIPVVHAIPAVRIRVISGSYEGVRGPVVDDFIDPIFLEIDLSKNAEFVYQTRYDHTFFAYIIKGSSTFGMPSSGFYTDAEEVISSTADDLLCVDAGKVALFSEGEVISIATTNEPVHFLLIGGRPIGEPVAWYGPIVMNTDDELKAAFEQFQVGTFRKHPHGAAP